MSEEEAGRTLEEDTESSSVDEADGPETGGTPEALSKMKHAVGVLKEARLAAQEAVDLANAEAEELRAKGRSDAERFRTEGQAEASEHVAKAKQEAEQELESARAKAAETVEGANADAERIRKEADEYLHAALTQGDQRLKEAWVESEDILAKAHRHVETVAEAKLEELSGLTERVREQAGSAEQALGDLRELIGTSVRSIDESLNDESWKEGAAPEPEEGSPNGEVEPPRSWLGRLRRPEPRQAPADEPDAPTPTAAD